MLQFTLNQTVQFKVNDTFGYTTEKSPSPVGYYSSTTNAVFETNSVPIVGNNISFSNACSSLAYPIQALYFNCK